MSLEEYFISYTLLLRSAHQRSALSAPHEVKNLWLQLLAIFFQEQKIRYKKAKVFSSGI